MLQNCKFVATLLKDRRGVTAVEYAVLVGVLVGVVATAFASFGTKISTYLAGITL